MSVWTDAAAFLADEFTAAMTDTVTIDRTTAQGAFSAATGTYAAPTTAQVYTGAGLVRPSGAVATPEFGQEQAERYPFAVLIPTTGSAQVDDRVTVDASGDSDLTGSVLVVRGVDRDTFHARLLLWCEAA